MRFIAVLALAMLMSGCSSWNVFDLFQPKAAPPVVAAVPAKPYQDRVPHDPKSPDVIPPAPAAGDPPPLITPPSITIAPTPRTAAQIKADCQAKAKTMKFGIHFWKRHKWVSMCRKQAAGT